MSYLNYAIVNLSSQSFQSMSQIASTRSLPESVDPEEIKRQMLGAAEAVAPSTRACLYAVAPDLEPYGHCTSGNDTSWLSRYRSFSAMDPFHPRHFIQLQRSVFGTGDGHADMERHSAYVEGFRRPMGVQFKAEVFLRNARGTILGGIRLSRAQSMGEFSSEEMSLLTALQPLLSTVWCRALAEVRVADQWLTLTPREKEILLCIRRGLSNKLICRELGIELPTVKSHVQRIMRKTGLLSRTALVANSQ